jgi:hypothetical protein
MRAARPAVAAAVVAAFLAGCSTPADDRSAGATAASSRTPAPATSERSAPSASAPSAVSKEPSPSEQQRGARADIPERVILRQLRDAAERIAKRLPSETAAPTPADIEPETNRALGYRLMLEFGYAADQWPYLDALWRRESGWNHLAENPSSGAYGIPQSLPAGKMAVVGSDWRTNPLTQIRWGLAYISARYRDPERAWAHSERHGWY